MQTTTITLNSKPQAGQYHASRIRTQKYSQGHKSNKSKIGRVRKSNNGFLTTIFTPLHVSLCDPLFSEENYRYIYNSLTNYSRLLKREFSVKYNPFNLSGLCDKFQEILPENNQFRLIVDEDKSKIKAWIIDVRYEDEILYFLPCGLLNQTEGTFREILIAFFQLLRRKQRFDFITETEFFEMMDEQMSMDDEQDIDSDWVMIFNEYKEGYKKELFDILSAKPKYSVRRLQTIVKDFRPKCRRESNLKLLIEEGLLLLNKRKLLFSYAMTPDGSYDDYTVRIDNIIQITYESDMFEEECIRYISDSAQNSGFDFVCAGALELTPRTQRRLKPKKFVIDFMDWLNRLNDELYHLRN